MVARAAAARTAGVMALAAILALLAVSLSGWTKRVASRLQTRLDQWPLAAEPVGDDYTPARPVDVWFDKGCEHYEQQRGIMMCADDNEEALAPVPPFGTNAAFMRGGTMIARGKLDGKVGTRERWNPPHEE